MVTKINAERFHELMNQEGKVVVKFGATWCGPCKVLTEQVKDLDEVIYDINVDEEMELASAFKINTIPRLLVFQSGQLVRMRVDLFKSKEEAKNFVEQ